MNKNNKEIMNRKTLFTKIIEREIPAEIIYEDEKTIVFLDIFPFEKGHCLVVPKIPYETIFEMPEKDFIDLQKIVFKISNHLKDKLNCGINLIQNNLKIAGQEINHVHFHIIPRKEKKLLLCKNSTKYLKNEIKNFSNKLKF